MEDAVPLLNGSSDGRPSENSLNRIPPCDHGDSKKEEQPNNMEVDPNSKDVADLQNLCRDLQQTVKNLETSLDQKDNQAAETDKFTEQVMEQNRTMSLCMEKMYKSMMHYATQIEKECSSHQVNYCLSEQHCKGLAAIAKMKAEENTMLQNAAHEKTAAYWCLIEKLCDRADLLGEVLDVVDTMKTNVSEWNCRKSSAMKYFRKTLGRFGQDRHQGHDEGKGHDIGQGQDTEESLDEGESHDKSVAHDILIEELCGFLEDLFLRAEECFYSDDDYPGLANKVKNAACYEWVFDSQVWDKIDKKTKGKKSGSHKLEKISEAEVLDCANIKPGACLSNLLETIQLRRNILDSENGASNSKTVEVEIAESTQDGESRVAFTTLGNALSECLNVMQNNFGGTSELRVFPSTSTTKSETHEICPDSQKFEKKSASFSSESPSQNARSPSQNVQSPSQNSQSPYQKRNLPCQNARSPSQNAQSLSQNARSRSQYVQSPSHNAQLPSQNTQSFCQSTVQPSQNAQPPRQNAAELPGQIAESPGQNADSPSPNAESPGPKTDSPCQHAQSSGQNSEPFSQNAESLGHDTVSSSQKAESPGQNTDSSRQHAESPGQDTDSSSHKAESPGQNTEPSSQNAESPGQDTESSSHKAESPGQNTEPSSQNAESPGPDTESSSQQVESSSQVKQLPNQVTDLNSQNVKSVCPQIFANVEGLEKPRIFQEKLVTERKLPLYVCKKEQYRRASLKSPEAEYDLSDDSLEEVPSKNEISALPGHLDKKEMHQESTQDGDHYRNTEIVNPEFSSDGVYEKVLRYSFDHLDLNNNLGSIGLPEMPDSNLFITHQGESCKNSTYKLEMKDNSLVGKGIEFVVSSADKPLIFSYVGSKMEHSSISSIASLPSFASNSETDHLAANELIVSQAVRATVKDKFNLGESLSSCTSLQRLTQGSYMSGESLTPDVPSYFEKQSIVLPHCDNAIVSFNDKEGYQQDSGIVGRNKDVLKIHSCMNLRSEHPSTDTPEEVSDFREAPSISLRPRICKEHNLLHESLSSFLGKETDKNELQASVNEEGKEPPLDTSVTNGGRDLVKPGTSSNFSITNLTDPNLQSSEVSVPSYQGKSSEKSLQSLSLCLSYLSSPYSTGSSSSTTLPTPSPLAQYAELGCSNDSGAADAKSSETNSNISVYAESAMRPNLEPINRFSAPSSKASQVSVNTDADSCPDEKSSTKTLTPAIKSSSKASPISNITNSDTELGFFLPLERCSSESLRKSQSSSKTMSPHHNQTSRKSTTNASGSEEDVNKTFVISGEHSSMEHPLVNSETGVDFHCLVKGDEQVDPTNVESEQSLRDEPNPGHSKHPHQSDSEDALNSGTQARSSTDLISPTLFLENFVETSTPENKQEGNCEGEKVTGLHTGDISCKVKLLEDFPAIEEIKEYNLEPSAISVEKDEDLTKVEPNLIEEYCSTPRSEMMQTPDIAPANSSNTCDTTFTVADKCKENKQVTFEVTEEPEKGKKKTKKFKKKQKHNKKNKDGPERRRNSTEVYDASLDVLQNTVVVEGVAIKTKDGGKCESPRKQYTPPVMKSRIGTPRSIKRVNRRLTGVKSSPKVLPELSRTPRTPKSKKGIVRNEAENDLTKRQGYSTESEVSAASHRDGQQGQKMPDKLDQGDGPENRNLKILKDAEVSREQKQSEADTDCTEKKRGGAPSLHMDNQNTYTVKQENVGLESKQVSETQNKQDSPLKKKSPRKDYLKGKSRPHKRMSKFNVKSGRTLMVRTPMRMKLQFENQTATERTTEAEGDKNKAGCSIEKITSSEKKTEHGIEGNTEQLQVTGDRGENAESGYPDSTAKIDFPNKSEETKIRDVGRLDMKEALELDKKVVKDRNETKGTIEVDTGAVNVDKGDPASPMFKMTNSNLRDENQKSGQSLETGDSKFNQLGNMVKTSNDGSTPKRVQGRYSLGNLAKLELAEFTHQDTKKGDNGGAVVNKRITMSWSKGENMAKNQFEESLDCNLGQIKDTECRTRNDNAIKEACPLSLQWDETQENSVHSMAKDRMNVSSNLDQVSTKVGEEKDSKTCKDTGERISKIAHFSDEYKINYVDPYEYVEYGPMFQKASRESNFENIHTNDIRRPLRSSRDRGVIFDKSGYKIRVTGSLEKSLKATGAFDPDKGLFSFLPPLERGYRSEPRQTPNFRANEIPKHVDRFISSKKENYKSGFGTEGYQDEEGQFLREERLNLPKLDQAGTRGLLEGTLARTNTPVGSATAKEGRAKPKRRLSLPYVNDESKTPTVTKPKTPRLRYRKSSLPKIPNIPQPQDLN